MNRVIIVTYDLVSPGQTYEPLLKRIKAYGIWARLGGSSYLIYTDQTPIQVRDNLSNVLDHNDKLYTGVAPAPSAWRGLSEEVSNWLQEHQS